MFSDGLSSKNIKVVIETITKNREDPAKKHAESGLPYTFI